MIQKTVVEEGTVKAATSGKAQSSVDGAAKWRIEAATAQRAATSVIDVISSEAMTLKTWWTSGSGLEQHHW